MEKILSISIAAYNAEKTLARCLDSFCIEHIMPDLDVMVINDGSTDRTAEIAMTYVRRWPNCFRLINKANGGHGSTINTGIKSAMGRYFKLVDADDWVERDGVIDLVGKLRNLDVDAVASPFIIVHDDKDSLSKTNVMISNKNSQSILGKTLAVNVLPADFDLKMHVITFKTALLQNQFTAVDEYCFYVDLEYIVFYFRLVKSVYISDIPVYNYLVGMNEQSTNIENMVKRRDQHLRVCQRLFPYYAQGIQCIDNVIEGAIFNEYTILLMIDDVASSKSELIAFENILLEGNSVLYFRLISHGINGLKKMAILVFMLRMLHFHGISFIHKLLSRKLLRN